MNEIEKRFVNAGAPIVSRCNNGDRSSGKKIIGYAATFGTRSQDLGGFVETIKRGAFSNVLKRAASKEPEHDVVALFNHDPNCLLARLSSGTLKLFEDERGLRYEITPTDTETARHIVALIERGDITGSSFSFSVPKKSEVWASGENGGLPLRSIESVDRLLDVGPVVFPAYLSSESKVSARCIALATELRTRQFFVNLDARAHAALAWANSRCDGKACDDCGTGAGGFKAGNTCATGSEKKNDIVVDRDQKAIDGITQGSVDSLELHTGSDGLLSIERREIHNRLISEMVPSSAVSPEGRLPILYMMGGGPGAGKTTMLKSSSVEILPGAVTINSDDVKVKLPEFDTLVAAGAREASVFVHEESSQVAKAAMNLAMGRKLDIVLDSTGDGRYESLKAKIDLAREAGYEVRGLYATLAVSLAEKITEARYKATGRWVPAEVVRNTHANVSDVVERAVAENLFDTIDVYDTNIKDNPRPVISHRRGGPSVVHDEKLFDDFMAKGVD